jgi:hypothetical protein
LEHLYWHAFSRPPQDEERQKCLALLAEAAQQGPQARREALEDLVWALLTSREFLFNH